MTPKPLKELLAEKGLSMQAFLKSMPGGNNNIFYKLGGTTSMPITYSTEKKICKAWQEKFGEKLLPHQYLEF